jgi:cytochrome b subunit of formate dehydrogenase
MGAVLPAGAIGRCSFLSLLLILLVIWPTTASAQVSRQDLENRRCLNCHGQGHIADLPLSQRRSMVAPDTTAGVEPGPRPGLFVPAQTFSGSPHEALACIDCHAEAATLPHAAQLPRPDCTTSCHSVEREAYGASAHAQAGISQEQLPDCITCHGGHDVLDTEDRQSRTHPLNMVKICGDCHQQHQVNGNGAKPVRAPVATYLASVHGRAVTRAGLAVAATCADCHGYHNVRPSTDPQSLVHRENVADTCGSCHLGIEEIYNQSIHGELLAQGDPEAPVCTSCHTAHAITRTDVPAFMRDIVAECGDCHDHSRSVTGRRSLYETYRMSYHGQVTRLGDTRAASCSDCHGAHDIRRIGNPDSRLHAGENRLETCQSCHPAARASFALFEPHADHRDRERFPLLWGVFMYFVIMMSVAFGFFGLHSVLWLIRSLIERYRHGPHPKPVANPHAIKRFNRVDRVNHAFVIISFFGLTLTGLPLFYSDQAWAQKLTVMLGGVQGAGLLHRFFAIMLIGNFIVHFVGVFRRFRHYGVKSMLFGPNTMLPRWKDITDCIGMFKWFFVGGKKPKFDRWTYWEKFDYVAEVGGSMIIAVSGMLLWFPEFFSWFLPGWMFNVAMIVHGFEALLAIGFIFTIHFFNAHLRLEKFPVDDVMFTGRLPEEEFKHERGAEYERLVASGEIEALRVAPPPEWYRPLAVAAGLLAMAIGTTLVVLIILAGLGWM